jgi:hypothetical protein
MATGPNKPFHSQMYTFVTKAASQASRPKPPPRLGPPPHLRRALAHLLADLVPALLGHVRAGTRPRPRWDSATSALGLGHDRAGTRPHLRWDSATSALGLSHICAGTRPHLRWDCTQVAQLEATSARMRQRRAPSDVVPCACFGITPFVPFRATSLCLFGMMSLCRFVEYDGI